MLTFTQSKGTELNTQGDQPLSTISLKAITGPPLTLAATRIKLNGALGRLKLTAGADKIQQIILYEVEDGNLTKVEEEFIPDKLRDAVHNGLSPNLKETSFESGFRPIPNTAPLKPIS